MCASASLIVHGSLLSGRGTRRRQSAGLSRLTNRSSRRYSRWVRSITSWRVCLMSWSSSGLANDLAEHLDPLVELGVVDQDRGKEPDHRPAARKDEHAPLLHRLDHRRRRLLELDRQHQAAAADLAELRQAELHNPLLEASALVGRPGVKVLVRKDLKRRDARGAHQRVAGERAAVACLGGALAPALGPD